MDVVLAVVALYAAARVDSDTFFLSGNPVLLETSQIVLFVCILLVSNFLLDLYGPHVFFIKNGSELLVRIGFASLTAFVILSTLYFFIFHSMLGRKVIVLGLLFNGALSFGWHYMFFRILHSSAMGERVLVLGAGDMATEICTLLSSSGHNYTLAGCYPLHAGKEKNEMLTEHLLEIAKKEEISVFVVSVAERRGQFPLRELLNCKLAGISIFDAPTFYERCLGKLMVQNLTPGSFIFADGFHLNAKLKFYKRMGDIIFSALALVVLLPFLPFVALLIKLDSRGTVFFKQLRVGEGEKKFTIYKFRTMDNDAEEKTGAVWAQSDDRRITRVGKILRKLRIDEFPQFFNVLKGDMSIIGPRPERPEFVESLKQKIPYYSERHCVKPGISGWAQIRYRYGACEEDSYEKLRYDLYYLKHFSFFLDAFIFMETVKVMLFGRGAR